MNLPRLRPHADGERLSPSGRARAAVIGGLIVAVGLAVSVLLAGEWRSSAASSDRAAFRSTAADLGDAIDSKLDVNVDFTHAMQAIATMEPGAGEERYMQWYAQLQRNTRLSPSVTAVLIKPVTAAQLPAFRREAESDPAFRARTGGRFQIVPPGRRPVYCFTQATVGNAARSALYPPLLDYCAPTLPGIGPSPYPALIGATTDTGSFTVSVLSGVAHPPLVGIAEAVYRRGAPVATRAERRAALSAVIGTSFDARALVGSVLGGHRSLTLALYHRNPGAPLKLIGLAGADAHGRARGYSRRIDIGHGWLLAVSGTPDHQVSPNDRGLIALGLGTLVTLLVLLVYLALASSRRQAWGLLGERTGELEHSALHDPLTDLPNRGLVLDRAEQILARARRLDVPVTALFVDLDGFRQVNDRHGHRVGDEVLCQVAARLKTALRDNDTVGRLGGDEFVMLVDTVGLDVAPELVAERILDLVGQPIELADGTRPPVSLTASIGIATGRPASAEELLQDAGLALEKAKASGRNGYVKFESAMQTAARDRIHLEMDLADALDGEQFFLAYQPMLDLESEQVVGVEALLRWRHPTSGVIPPDAFIPIAEENGLIVALGRWVLEQACAQGAAWRRNGFPLNISVNASARQLERPEFVEEVRAALGETGLPPASLTIEITETVLMRQPEETAKLLTELKALGVRIAVDDFGTGYSSLSYLRQFPVDSLKIDRTFITGLAMSSEAHALTHTLIQLGKALGLETLAEGVEHHSQVLELQREGCDLAQGFLFARPLPPEVLERFVREHTRAVRPPIVA